MGIFIGFSDTIRWGSDNQIYRIRRNGLQEFRAITIEKRQPIRFVKLFLYYAHSALPSSLSEIVAGKYRPIIMLYSQSTINSTELYLYGYGWIAKNDCHAEQCKKSRATYAHLSQPLCRNRQRISLSLGWFERNSLARTAQSLYSKSMPEPSIRALAPALKLFVVPTVSFWGSFALPASNTIFVSWICVGWNSVY